MILEVDICVLAQEPRQLGKQLVQNRPILMQTQLLQSHFVAPAILIVEDS